MKSWREETNLNSNSSKASCQRLDSGERTAALAEIERG
jgi:hypothetical protein